MPNKILAFDVANQITSVAVALGSEIIAYEEELQPSMQAEKLIPMIESTLQNAKMGYQDLDYLAVTVGTGSFTGIRIGIAAAKAILYAGQLKPIGVTNFELAFYRLKMQVAEFDRAFIILNAYRQQLYIQEFTFLGKKDAPRLIDQDEIRKLISPSNINERVICAGSGVYVVFNEIQQIANLTILPRFPAIKAMHLARYADQKVKNNCLASIEPLYVRPPDAIIPNKG